MSRINFLWANSYGGTEDHLLDPAVDRVADVFPTEEAIAAAGFSSQEASGLLAVIGPRLVGIPVNRIPRFVRILGGRRFSQWQADEDIRRRRRAAGTTTRPRIATGEAVQER